MSRIRQTSRDLSDLMELVLKAMFGILFAVVVSKRVREEILSFGKKPKQG